ncbi:M23 family metallopeptidase [Oceanobacillus saliphilus]|uniref:M23 family metallopeptidase n=1 Tax=Oceanobacillus saliphilus TaxID=2925834 RepID=UPI00201DB88E|nr:M23 family metallopeptidase [Oceanobacillus saliphilus]
MFTRYTENNTGKSKSFFRKIVIIACLGIAFTVTTAYANDGLGTVYHVYVNEDHVGKVDDKEVVNNLIDSKVEEGEEEFENLSITIGEEISYIPEKVFNASTNNQKVANRLDEELSIKANAVELRVDDETVGYFDSEDTAKEVLKQYISAYVDEESVKEIRFEKQNDDLIIAGMPNPDKIDLSADESIVMDLTLSGNISILSQKVLPTAILSADEGIAMLEKGTLEDKVHTVKEGEVLGGIAAKYELSVNKLVELNDSLDKDSILKPDQEINVTEYEAFADIIVYEEKKMEESLEFETEIIESDDMYKGEEKVKQHGKDGTKEVLYSIEKTNGKQTDKEVLQETVTKEPVKEIVMKGTKVISSTGTGNMVWPAVGGYISSHVGERWGKTHKGIDIARPTNKNILAADNGVIESAGYNSGGYGNKIVINHNNGMKTIYAHLASIDVKVGQVVEKGSKIGVMGSTGNSTGIHLHFEVYKNGSLQNPTKYVSQ